MPTKGADNTGRWGPPLTVWYIQVLEEFIFCILDFAFKIFLITAWNECRMQHRLWPAEARMTCDPIRPKNIFFRHFLYYIIRPQVGCDMGMGHTAVLGSQVSQVWVQFQKSRPKATPWPLTVVSWVFVGHKFILFRIFCKILTNFFFIFSCFVYSDVCHITSKYYVTSWWWLTLIKNHHKVNDNNHNQRMTELKMKATTTTMVMMVNKGRGSKHICILSPRYI